MGLLTGFKAKLIGRRKKSDSIICVNYRTSADFDEPGNSLPTTWQETPIHSRTYIRRSLQRNSTRSSRNSQSATNKSPISSSPTKSKPTKTSAPKPPNYSSPRTSVSKVERLGPLKNFKRLSNSTSKGNSSSVSKPWANKDSKISKSTSNLTDEYQYDLERSMQNLSHGETQSQYDVGHYDDDEHHSKSTLIFMTEDHDNSKKSSRDEDNGGHDEFDYVPDSIERNIEVNQYIVEFPFEKANSKKSVTSVTHENQQDKYHGKIEAFSTKPGTKVTFSDDTEFVNKTDTDDNQYFLPSVEDDNEYKVNVVEHSFHKNIETDDETDDDQYVARKSYRMVNGMTFSSQASNIFFGGEDEFEKPKSVQLQNSDNISNRSSISA